MWEVFESSLARLCGQAGAQWCDPTERFQADDR
jgi:hypothetical protein